jgi:putative transcriptional regulator
MGKIIIKSNLKELLDKKGISIREFAVKSDLHFETARRYYNDTNRQFQRETLAVICEALDIGIDELLLLEREEDGV